MLNNLLKDKKLILGSGSPRRQQFFTELGLDFEIRVIPIEEIYPPELKAEEITEYLAALKARAFDSLADDEILITSDTIVWHHDKAVGKPVDYDDAFTILKSLSASTHNVVSSVCIKSNANEVVFSDRTRVTFTELSDDAIHYYLTNFEPFDKAGAYGIQDWIGLVGISKIEGSYTNVVGLPTEKMYAALSAFNA